jgi:hypothetical protein
VRKTSFWFWGRLSSAKAKGFEGREQEPNRPKAGWFSPQSSPLFNKPILNATLTNVNKKILYFS